MLNGEDVTFGGNDLFVDLVPKMAWGQSGSNLCAKWNELSRTIREAKNNICEVCNVQTNCHAHERYEFIELNKTHATYKLKRIMCMCVQCHMSTHYGRSCSIGMRDAARNQLKKITKLDDDALQEHVSAAGALWKRRNSFTISVDLSLLTDNGYEIKPLTGDKLKRQIYMRGAMKGFKLFVEYSASNLSSCRCCKKNFTQNELKIGTSSSYLGAPDFKHLHCFEESVGGIDSFDCDYMHIQTDDDSVPITCDDIVQGTFIEDDDMMRLDELINRIHEKQT
jgi:hypothetical protein